MSNLGAINLILDSSRCHRLCDVIIVNTCTGNLRRFTNIASKKTSSGMLTVRQVRVEDVLRVSLHYIPFKKEPDFVPKCTVFVKLKRKWPERPCRHSSMLELHFVDFCYQL